MKWLPDHQSHPWSHAITVMAIIMPLNHAINVMVTGCLIFKTRRKPFLTHAQLERLDDSTLQTSETMKELLLHVTISVQRFNPLGNKQQAEAMWEQYYSNELMLVNMHDAVIADYLPTFDLKEPTKCFRVFQLNKHIKWLHRQTHMLLVQSIFALPPLKKDFCNSKWKHHGMQRCSNPFNQGSITKTETRNKDELRTLLKASSTFPHASEHFPIINCSHSYMQTQHNLPDIMVASVFSCFSFCYNTHTIIEEAVIPWTTWITCSKARVVGTWHWMKNWIHFHRGCNLCVNAHSYSVKSMCMDLA